ncbi:MAG: 16S rRNA (cytosine(1402)-N(4))-methyltransferase [Candidatus Krumholzibacteriia bacterium]
MSHEPVLLDASVDLLRRGGPGLFVDATLGAGGHAEALLRALPEATLLGVDRDASALALASERLSPFGDRVFFCTSTSADCPTRCRRSWPSARLTASRASSWTWA